MTALTAINRATVENMSLGFRLGRQYRTFFEFELASGSSAVIKVVCSKDFLLQSQNFFVNSGSIRFSAVVGATESGSFSSILPIVGKNRAPSYLVGNVYTSGMVLSSGGSITGGTEVEVMRFASQGTTTHQSTVNGPMDNPRALPSGTYYLKLSNTDNSNSIGVYTIEWEEIN